MADRRRVRVVLGRGAGAPTDKKFRFEIAERESQRETPPCGCLIGVAAATTPWLGAARGSGRRHPQRPKHKTKFGGTALIVQRPNRTGATSRSCKMQREF